MERDEARILGRCIDSHVRPVQSISVVHGAPFPFLSL
jgi:hypothetical protein